MKRREKFLKNLPVSGFGDLRTIEVVPQFQGSFEYTVSNSRVLNLVTSGSGSVTQSQAMGVTSSGTTAGSKARLESVRFAKYRSGLGGLLRFTALFTTFVSGTEQLVGLADEPGSSESFKNGYMIGYYNDVFGFHRFQNDAVFSTPLTDWDDPLDGSGLSGMILDISKLNVFFIEFQYLGAGGFNIWVENPSDSKAFIAHIEPYSNLNIVPSVFNPNFKFMSHVHNGATTSDITIKNSSYSYFIEGKTKYFETHQPQFSSGTITKSSVTTEIAIFTIRNSTVYSGKTNFIEAIMEFFTTSVEAASANNLAGVRLVKNATLGGTPSYSSINVADSIMEIDTAGTTVTGGVEIFPGQLAGKNDKEAQNLINFEIILSPGETITVAASSTNSATFKSALLWQELI